GEPTVDRAQAPPVIFLDPAGDLLLHLPPLPHPRARLRGGAGYLAGGEITPAIPTDPGVGLAHLGAERALAESLGGLLFLDLFHVRLEQERVRQRHDEEQEPVDPPEGEPTALASSDHGGDE